MLTKTKISRACLKAKPHILVLFILSISRLIIFYIVIVSISIVIIIVKLYGIITTNNIEILQL